MEIRLGCPWRLFIRKNGARDSNTHTRKVQQHKHKKTLSMSKITTLIPAYKNQFLGDVFLALRRQSFQDFHVILSDDSPDATITKMIENGHWGDLTNGLNLTVVRGPQNARRNFEHLFDLWNNQSPFLHINLDDDIIFPEFYSTHIAAHALNPCCATVSQRWLSIEDCTPAGILPLPDFVQRERNHIFQLPNSTLLESTIGPCQNWLGEFTNMVLSAEGAKFYPRPNKGEISYYGLQDIGFLLNASQSLPVTFIREYLSVFRQNAHQSTRRATFTHDGRIDYISWVTLALTAWRGNRINAVTATKSIGIATQRINHLFSEDDVFEEYFAILDYHSSTLEELYSAYQGFWLRLLQSDRGTAPNA